VDSADPFRVGPPDSAGCARSVVMEQDAVSRDPEQSPPFDSKPLEGDGSRAVFALVERALQQPRPERLAELRRGLDELHPIGPAVHDEQSQQALLDEAIRLLARCEELESIDEAGSDPNAGAGELVDIAVRGQLVEEWSAESSGEDPRSSRLAPGESIGPFEVVRFVAAGGMGEVYEAMDRRVARRVALKVLPHAASPERAMRFEREARALARVDHPTITRLFEWGDATMGRDGGRRIRYIAMEFIDGESLSDASARLRASNPGDPAPILELLLPIVDAVGHAHARGVLHRDIKPGNILVDSTGNARLLDFGVASLTDYNGQATLTATGENTRPGTLVYMSPEQIRGGSARFTTQSDLYALGLVLAEAITGQPVVQLREHGIAEVVAQVLSGDPPAIAQRRGPRSGARWRAVEFVVRRALSKDPALRQSSATALAEDLRLVLQGRQPSGRTLGALGAAIDFVSRNRRALAVAAGLVAVVVVAAGVAGVQYWRARQADARSEVLVGQLLEGSRPFLVDLHQRLREEGQPLQARRVALESTAKYLDWVREHSDEDKRVLRQVARHYAELANVAGDTAQGSLGDAEAALDLYGRARSILDALIAQKPDPDLLMMRARILRSIGGFEGLPERARYFRDAQKDQLLAVSLMAPGPERDLIEREALMTAIQSARVALDVVAIEPPIERLEQLAAEPRFSDNADVLSELGLAARYHADLLALDSRSAEALVAAQKAQAAFLASIDHGLDEFTNNRHLARIEMLLVELQPDGQTAEQSLELLTAALERARKATSLKPTDSFYRLSFIEAVGLFAEAAAVVANSRLAADDPKGASHIAERAIAAAQDGLEFARSLPLEGAPHPREGALVQDTMQAIDKVRSAGQAAGAVVE
jgi:hypothetical protein